MQRTFRLFVSSPFSDFVQEREVLQTKVFPKIKDYCREYRIAFQPIDLRWGVSDEAQLDQKTLELCLNEVRTCKTHPHPNFLIMLGDRYGWVPLPYAIEKEIFENLLLFMTEENKSLVSSWYYLDENALPISYILKERSGDYVTYENWEKVEKALRPILQQAVLDAKLSEEQKRPFFLSATEAEVEEGIVPYIAPTPFQKALLEKFPHLKELDTQHIFGFFRDIDPRTQQGKQFIVDEIDYDHAQAFKARVQKYLSDEQTTLHVKTTQTDQKHLDVAYLAVFETRMIDFLKAKIDTFLQDQHEVALTPLEKECSAQAFYHSQKLKGFIQTPELETLLSQMKNYTTTKEPSSAFILYGSSGRGKSSLMAQAIEESKAYIHSKVLYRYVGATPNSTSAKSIWLSLFEELGIDLRSEAEKQRDDQEEKSLHVNQNDETYEQFSQRLHNAIVELNDEVVFFIDAIDQIGQEEPFIWLPYTLPSHIKLIISTLEDAHYEKDSKYLKTLQTKSKILYEIPPFSQPKELLTALLSKEKRRVTSEQMEYFLTRYETTKTPLYITIASQEMKHWKSYQNNYDLATGNQGIIQEYIENLSKLYHHHKDFVTKLLCYLVASKHGLSESEILTLLSADKAFIQTVAPETYHKNLTQELPLVHWSRIQTQLQPFFKQQSLDNEELLSFFHREFIDAIISLPQYKEEHERGITDTQTIIQTVQEQDFDSNRWGKLYATLVLEYYLSYKDKEKNEAYSEFISNLHYEMWIESYLQHFHNIAIYHSIRNHTDEAIGIGEHLLGVTKVIYDKKPEHWAEEYTRGLNNLARAYGLINHLSEAISLEEESLVIQKALYAKKPERWAIEYTTSLSNLASSYKSINRLTEAIALEEESLAIRKALYAKKPERWAIEYTTSLNNLSIFKYHSNCIQEAITFQEESCSIQKPLYEKNPERWAEIYSTSLNNLAFLFFDVNRIEEAINLEEKALSIKKALYFKNPECLVDQYTRSLINLSYSYGNVNRIEEAISLAEEAFSIRKALYFRDPECWANEYLIAFNGLIQLYINISRFEEALVLSKNGYEISKNHLGISHPFTKQLEQACEFLQK